MNLNSYSAESPFSRKDLMAGGALLAFYLITRITHLTVLPVFNDEAVYLHWAKLIEEDSGNLWISIEADSKKPLLIWLLVLGFKLFHDPLWAGRMVSVAAGMGSLVGIYLVGCRYHSRRVGQLGALLFVFSPYHLFFDRMVYEAALIDCFFIWSLWLTLSLVRGETQGSLFLYVGLAVVTGLGLLTQSVAVLFVFLPLLITWIYSGEKKILPWTMALPIYGSGIGLGALPYGILYFTVEKFPIKNYFIPTTHNLGQMGMLDLLAGIPVKLYGGVDGLLGYFFHYLTWPVFLSATVYFFWQFMKFERRDFILLIYF
ncbi:MAG: glycosyltransferase family 39 protein, partial [Nitrospinota bacterium]|nr:glycosyltransferase family 39 protein [Nitrospinota bacterium]